MYPVAGFVLDLAFKDNGLAFVFCLGGGGGGHDGDVSLLSSASCAAGALSANYCIYYFPQGLNLFWCGFPHFVFLAHLRFLLLHW